MIEVSIIGAGNVAYHIYKCIEKLDKYQTVEIYSRLSESNVNWSKVPIVHSLSNLKKVAIYIIAVSDHAISEIARNANFDEHSIVVHTSGAMGMDVLSGSSRNVGVLYPLQTLLKHEEVDFSETPFFIESNNECTSYVLHSLANELSDDVSVVSSEDRMKYHAMAVFTQNFSQYLCKTADKFLEKNDLNFEKLIPLLRKNVERLLDPENRKRMTGPAVREDENTINKHLNVLKDEKGMTEIYNFLSKKISTSRNDS